MSACPSVRMVETSRSTESTSDKTASEGPGSGGRDGSARPPRRLWGADLSASVTVFLIALPLSLGIALATGAPLQAGLVAAAVGGIVGGRLGGAPLQISGPAAGLTVVTAELIQTYGWRTTCAITVLAGLTQLLLACCRVARSALVVSPAIVHGMLAGIGVSIALAQLHIVLGGGPESSAIGNVKALPAQLADPHPWALSVSGLTVAVLLLWPRVREWGGRAGRLAARVPAALTAVGLATLVASSTGMALPRVDLPSWRSHALPTLPEGPVLGLLAAVLTVTLVASVESLLSAVAVDKLTAKRDADTRVPRADLDRELRGQGAANVVSGSLGGLPVTGVAVRSAANVAAGAMSRNSAILHGFWVLLAAGALVTMLELIPLAALAALVMVVGVQMVNLTHVRSVTRHREVVVYAATALGVVLLGVLEGVGVGILVAVAVALHRLARTRISLEAVDGTEATEEAASPGTVEASGDGMVSGAGGVARAGTEMRRTAGDRTAGEARTGRAPGAAEVTAGGICDSAAPLGTWSVAGSHRPGGEPRDRVTHRVRVQGQLTFLAVPRLSRVLSQVPEGTRAVVELDGSFMDHAAYETLEDWRTAHTAHGGTAEVSGLKGEHLAEPSSAHRCMPWTPWRDHQCTRPHQEPEQPEHHASRRGQLLGGVRNFQRATAPHMREELARLAREGQHPSQLFITCADSRLVPSMITSSGPGDLFTVRNVGNLVPRAGVSPEAASGDESVAAAIEYAVEVLRVGSITVCGHSGCGAMQALRTTADNALESPDSPLSRWLAHGRPSLELATDAEGGGPRFADREAVDAVEALCLTNVVQQLRHLTTYGCVARRMREGTLELHGMYFHVGEAQTYVLEVMASGPDAVDEAVFAPVRPEAVVP